jgi:NAD(P)H dehydrogenase (quinone)
MIGVTGATGKLGRFVIDELLHTVPALEIIAIARDTAKASDLAAKGIIVRQGDYEAPDTFLSALTGVDKLLFISSNTPGKREAQHRAVIEAAKQAGAGFIAYTSMLHASSSPLSLREEHVRTEELLADSGLSHALLRNGWYTENYTQSLADVIKSGEIIGGSGDGRISAAARADYAAAAAAVLVAKDDQGGRIYELAGDDAFTMAEFATEVARQSGKTVVYRDLSRVEYKAHLVAKGLPESEAAGFAATIDHGGQFDGSHQLRQLIGRPTTPWTEIIAVALRALG